jgi:CelD/BcsL family acetyltransferase involved in cellulose biosynthesis
VIRVEELTSVSDLEAILPEWWSLYDRCPGATPFHSPEWLLAWWRHFGFGRLWTLALLESNRLVALLALFLHTYQDPDRGGLQQLSPIGIGITDYTDFLIEPGHAASACQAVLHHVLDRKTLWDEADLQGLRADSALLGAATPPELNIRRELGQPCPVINLPNCPEQFLASLTSNRRHSYLAAQRKLRQLGSMSFESAGPASLTYFFDALFGLNQGCRLNQNRPAIFEDANSQDFHREVGHAFLCRGWLRMTAMRIGERIASVLYGFATRGRAYYYQSGFELNLARLSPGTAIMGHAIEDSIREGLSEVDLLRGDEPYKYWWGASDRQTYRLLLWH